MEQEWTEYYVKDPSKIEEVNKTDKHAEAQVSLLQMNFFDIFLMSLIFTNLICCFFSTMDITDPVLILLFVRQNKEQL